MPHWTAQSLYNARQAGITSAIVVAVLVPVGICGFCFLLRLRQNASERRWTRPSGSYVVNHPGVVNRQAPAAAPPVAVTGNKIPVRSSTSSSSSSNKKSGEVIIHDDGKVTERQDARYESNLMQRSEAIDTGSPSVSSSLSSPSSGKALDALSAKPPTGLGPHKGHGTTPGLDQGPKVKRPPPTVPNQAAGSGKAYPQYDSLASADIAASSPTTTSGGSQDSDHSDEIESQYDGVYYTGEPLRNKVAPEFPTKVMDVDIDIPNYHKKPTSL